MLNNRIRHITERAREDWLVKQCQELEQLDAEDNTQQLYEVVRRFHKESRQAIQNKSILSKEDKLLVDL